MANLQDVLKTVAQNSQQQMSALQNFSSSLFNSQPKANSTAMPKMESGLMSVAPKPLPVTVAAPKVDTSPTPVDKLTTQKTTVAPVTSNVARNNFSVAANQVVEQASQKPVEEKKPSEREQALSDVMSLQKKQGEQGQRTLDLQAENKLAEKKQQLADINAKAITTNDAYKKKIEEVRKNAGGKLTANVQAEVDKLESERDRRLADIGIEQAVAQGNIDVANDIIKTAIEAEFEPLKNQIESLKTYQQMFNDDLTSSEKTKLDSIIRQQEMDYQFGLDSAMLAKKQAYDLQNTTTKRDTSWQDIDGQRVLVDNQTGEIISGATTQLANVELARQRGADKIEQIEGLLNNTSGIGASAGLKNVSINPFNFNKVNDWRADVINVLSKLTVDELGRVKADGVTFGALSDPERKAVGDAASALNAGMIQENGLPTGRFNLSEGKVTKELQTIQRLAEQDFLRRTGQSYQDFKSAAVLPPEDIDEVNSLMGVSNFNPASYFPKQ